jgi:hypothetical protein
LSFSFSNRSHRSLNARIISPSMPTFPKDIIEFAHILSIYAHIFSYLWFLALFRASLPGTNLTSDLPVSSWCTDQPSQLAKSSTDSESLIGDCQ